MAESNHGQLRFDILEKVRLHPQQPGIRSLLDLDLYPDVEIEDQGTHLKIHGYLRLNGEYVGGEEVGPWSDKEGEPETVPEETPASDNREIAYVIPVEITLPADRVDVDRISSEVQSFDYKVLSPFELQIEALLTIDGILEDSNKEEVPAVEGTDPVATFSVPDSGHMEMEVSGLPEEEPLGGDEFPSTGEDLYLQQGEYQFVHVARSGSDEEEFRAGIASQEAGSEEGEEQEESQGAVPSPERKEKETDSIKEEAPEEAVGEKPPKEKPNNPKQADEEEKSEASQEDGKTIVFNPARPERERQGMNLSDPFLRQPHADEFDFQELDEERDRLERERRIHPEETATKPEEGDQNASEAEEVQEAKDTEESQERTGGTGLEWARWILGEEKEEFVKMCMVIVQKEDSIESLSERYEVPASKILTMNRMESNVLEEGQIVYIPVNS